MAIDYTVRLGADGHCAWTGTDAAKPGEGGVDDALAAAVGRSVRLIVPGADVLLARVAVPVAQRGRALAAVPWAIEDRLADDVEALHFALGDRHDDGQWSVAVVARRAMDDWLARCAEAGIAPASMVPEPLALPEPETGEWVALEEAGQVTVRTGRDSGFACEPAMLDRIVAALEAPERIRRLEAHAAPWPAALQPLLGAPESVADAVTPLTHGDGIELLQGPYSRRERAGRALRRWRVPGVLALLVLMVAGLHLAFEYAAMVEREATLRARMRTILHRTFPDIEHISDPRAQMASRLRALRDGGSSGAGFAAMMARVGAVMVEADDASLAGLTWRTGTLELEVRAENLQALDRVRQALNAAGLHTELRGIDQRESGVEGTIGVSEGNA